MYWSPPKWHLWPMEHASFPLPDEVHGARAAGSLLVGDVEVAAVRDGRVTFRLEDGRMLDPQQGAAQLRHVDRAWASTVHAFQGRTVDTVIAAMGANHPNLTTQKTLYVEISRARDRAELVTDDKAALPEQIEAATGERIAALEAVELDKEKGREAALDTNRSAELDGGAAMSREREWTSSPEMEQPGRRSRWIAKSGCGVARQGMRIVAPSGSRYPVVRE